MRRLLRRLRRRYAYGGHVPRYTGGGHVWIAPSRPVSERERPEPPRPDR